MAKFEILDIPVADTRSDSVELLRSQVAGEIPGVIHSGLGDNPLDAFTELSSAAKEAGWVPKEVKKRRAYFIGYEDRDVRVGDSFRNELQCELRRWGYDLKKDDVRQGELPWHNDSYGYPATNEQVATVEFIARGSVRVDLIPIKPVFVSDIDNRWNDPRFEIGDEEGPGGKREITASDFYFYPSMYSGVVDEGQLVSFSIEGGHAAMHKVTSLGDGKRTSFGKYFSTQPAFDDESYQAIFESINGFPNTAVPLIIALGSNTMKD